MAHWDHTPDQTQVSVHSLCFAIIIQTNHAWFLLYINIKNTGSKLLEWRWNGTEFARQRKGNEQRKKKTRVSEDANYWLTFLWTLLGMRIRERRLIAALVELPGLSSPSPLTDDTAEGRRELAWGKEENEAPLWVYKFTSYPWPNTQTVSSMRRPIITPASLSPCFFISFSPNAPNPQWFIKWPTVLAARPGAEQLIDPKSLFKEQKHLNSFGN